MVDANTPHSMLSERSMPTNRPPRSTASPIAFSSVKLLPEPRSPVAPREPETLPTVEPSGSRRTGVWRAELMLRPRSEPLLAPRPVDTKGTEAANSRPVVT